MTHPFNSADIRIFSPEISNFDHIRNTNKNCILIPFFYYFLTLIDSLEVVLINMIVILIIPAKLPTPGLLKIKVFRNNNYDVTNKVLWRDSNYIIDMVMWPKFGISSTYWQKLSKLQLQTWFHSQLHNREEFPTISRCNSNFVDIIRGVDSSYYISKVRLTPANCWKLFSVMRVRMKS